VQLIDHEAQDSLFMLCYHANAIALPQAADEVFLGPGELEAVSLDPLNLRHVPPNHPPDVDADALLSLGAHTGLLP
jgi:hypothetical protein